MLDGPELSEWITGQILDSDATEETRNTVRSSWSKLSKALVSYLTSHATVSVRVPFVGGILASGPGYLKLTNGSLICWGNFSIATSTTTVSNAFGTTSGVTDTGNVSVTFPLAFSSTPSITFGSGTTGITRYTALSPTSVTIEVLGNKATTGFILPWTGSWTAIGSWSATGATEADYIYSSYEGILK